MAFRTILTEAGMAAVAAATASGVPINLTHMAVGDGLGNPVTPEQDQTVLVREMYRSTINRVVQHPGDATRFSAELIVPASEGGFTLREVGVFTSSGALFAVGNLPDTYKPAASEGAYADTVVRVEFVVSNASAITLVSDPAVAVASQSWVLNAVDAAHVIPGGTTGQFLNKASNADGDYQWTDLSEINVVVDIIEEQQTLSSGQTTVNWATVTNDGLSVYINGIRLHRGAGTDEWQPAAAPNHLTRIILGQSYSAGAKITGVQNEPLGGITQPLARDQNLADVPSVATARTNLDVYSKAEADDRSRAPGDIFFTARETAPPRSLKANGAAVSRTVYSALFAAIGTRFGAGNGSTTFNLPDLRGEFLRGWDDARGVDLGRALGSAQAAAFGQHSHTATVANSGNHTHTGDTNNAGSHNHHVVRDAQVNPSNSPLSGTNSVARYSSTGGEVSALLGGTTAGAWMGLSSSAGVHSHPFTTDAGGTHTHSVTLSVAGGAETRPRNVALLACIRF